MHRDDLVVVVGSGIAGLSAALRIASARPVELLTKGPLVSGSTSLAQGGIAAALQVGDAPGLHALDTINAGAGLCDEGVVHDVCAQAPARVADLVGLGVDFDRDAAGGLHLAREAAHGRARVAHAGGDATGARISAALAACVVAHGSITVREHRRAIDVLRDAGSAVGVRVRRADGTVEDVRAAATVLATGGLGGLFSRTTNPAGATADGMAMAWRAGAALVDLELIQFHPTALAVEGGDGGWLPLISEALRGAGATLHDETGRRFMVDTHPLAELAPRDVVAREIAARAERGRVTLTLPGIGPAEAARRFPSAARACRDHGLVLGRDPVPVAPAAHFAMGGVMTDLAGRSGLPQLFAIGECASTGMHGANRLASNAMLEGAVMAAECAAAIERGEPWPDGDPGPSRSLEPSVAAAAPAEETALVRGEMSRAMGVERDPGRLGSAARRLDEIDADRLDLDGRSLHDVARKAVAGARMRAESRGAHHRRDHEGPDPRWARRVAWVGDDHHSIPLVHNAVRSAA